MANRWKPSTPQKRFWEKVNRWGPIPDSRPDLGCCWLWTGARVSKGYGSFMVSAAPPRRTVAAHRYAYELLIGPIPDGLTIDHLCLVKRCVNPCHMEVVTAGENRARAHRAQTHCRRAGHEFTPENTVLHSKSGARMCRACQREMHHEAYLRRKSVA